jgi:hypothetical protein
MSVTRQLTLAGTPTGRVVLHRIRLKGEHATAMAQKLKPES